MKKEHETKSNKAEDEGQTATQSKEKSVPDTGSQPPIKRGLVGVVDHNELMWAAKASEDKVRGLNGQRDSINSRIAELEHELAKWIASAEQVAELLPRAEAHKARDRQALIDWEAEWEYLAARQRGSEPVQGNTPGTDE